jgi:hypothetical protein
LATEEAEHLAGPVELPEQPDMEHVVEASTGRQSEANGDVVDQLDDAVRPEEARPELAPDGLGQR